MPEWVLKCALATVLVILMLGGMWVVGCLVEVVWRVLDRRSAPAVRELSVYLVVTATGGEVRVQGDDIDTDDGGQLTVYAGQHAVALFAQGTWARVWLQAKEE